MCFLATAVVFILQLIPVVGLLLMFLLAPFWSMVLINIGFIAMIFEVRAGTLPKWALVFPVLYFGGYYVMAIVERAEAWHQISVEASKDVPTLNFDENKDALLLDQRKDSGEDIAHDLLAFYHLPAVLTQINPGNFWVFRNDTNCRRPSPSSYGSSSLSEYLQHSLLDDRCIVSSREQYTGPVFQLKFGAYRMEEGNQGRELLITSPDGSQATLHEGWVSALSWFPLPGLGCSLNDQKASWDCFAGFNRDRLPLMQPVDNVLGSAVAVAKVLGLRRNEVQ